MKTELPRSFYWYRGILYFFLVVGITFSAIQAFSFLVIAAAGKKVPLIYHSEIIDLNISRTPGGDILTLEKLRPGSVANYKEGDITLHSKTGESYKGYYSPTFGKLQVNLPDDFSENLKIIIIISFVLNSMLSIAFLYIMISLMSSVEDGTPFIMQNAKYIGRVAAILLYFVFATFLVHLVMKSYIKSIFNLSFNMYLDPFMLNAMFFGIVLAILSYVLKQGVRMKEEQDLTI